MKRAWFNSFLLFSIFAGALLPIMAHASTLDSSEELATLLPPSDSICEGNAYITTQAEWDQFAADYAGCTTFIGDITIDNSSAAIDSVYGLDSLQVIVGNLNISGVRIYGFANLDSLMGDLNLSAVDIYTHFILSYVLNLRIEHSVSNGSGALQPSFNFDTNEWGNAFGFLQSCETLTLNGIGIIESIFNALTFVRKIEIENSEGSATFIGNVFNNLSTLDTLAINGGYILSGSFQNLTSIDVLNFGNLNLMLVNVSNSFDNLINAGSIYIDSFEIRATFPNLSSAESILLVENGSSTLASFDLPILHSLEVLGQGWFILERRNLFFPNLFEVAGNLNITVNYGTETVNLPALSAVAGNFNVGFIGEDGPDAPFSTFSAPNLTFIGGTIDLWGGANLSTCECPAFCPSANYSPNWAYATGGPGCSSIEEIQAQCLGNYASGFVYYDIDCDSEFNNDDAFVSYPILLQGDTLPIGSSGGTGYFFVPLELNSSVSLYAQHSADWSTTGPVIITTDSTLQVMDDIHLGLCPVNILHDVSVHLNASMQPRPGFTVRHNIIAQNEWPGSDSVSVTFDTSLMPGATITGFAAGGTQQGATVSFATDLLYGQPQVLWVDVVVPVGTPLGTTYTATASIALADGNDEDNYPENNTYSLQHTVIGSYDPNDKLVTPAIIDLLDVDATATEWFEYTIRFQNTGTAEAIFVRVLDTLSQVFDMTSFELIATSHPCEVTFHDNLSIDWFFDNIMLPDSFSNEPESHGFIQFRIRTHALSEPSVIENAAGIYFDFNEPVITPPAITQVVICAEQGSACDDGDACTVNDVIQADCTCSGEQSCEFSVLSSADILCDGSDGTFQIQGIPNAYVIYTINTVLDTLQLDNLGSFSITITNDSSAFSASADTIVITLTDYYTSTGQAANSISASDTLIYRNHKTPVISLYSTNFEECYIYPNPLPYVLYELETAQNSTVHYSFNYENLHSWSSSQSQFALDFPDGVYPNPETPNNPLGFTFQAGISYPNTEYSSNFSFDSNLDTTAYVLLESNMALSFVPENSDLIIRIDSIDYDGCLVHYDSVNNVVITPSIIVNIDTYSQALSYNYSENHYTPIPYYYWLYAGGDYIWYLFATTNGGGFFLEQLHNNQDYFEFDIDLIYKINTDTVFFHTTQNQPLSVDTVGNYKFESYFNINSVGTLTLLSAVDTFPRNDTLRIDFLGYRGLDGCFHESPIFPVAQPPQEQSVFNFLVNPTVFLGTDTIQYTCNNSPLILQVPEIPVQTTPNIDPNIFYDSAFTFWFTDYNDPLNSYVSLDSTLEITSPGIYYNVSGDSAHNVFYEKQYVVLLNESGTPCDDLDPCTLNDITQPDCTCIGTYTDTDEDGICDALDDCDSSLAGTVCDDGDDCTVNDVIQVDCVCAGSFADTDGDGLCDSQENCIGAPVALDFDNDTTLFCDAEIPMFNVVFTMNDGSDFSVSFMDSVLTSDGCNLDILQVAVAFNECGDSTVVSRLISIVDATPPTFTECPSEITVDCNTYGYDLPLLTATDNCTSEVTISYEENCLDCNSDSTVYPCATPIRPADNPCGYPYDWSLALFNLPNAHRWYQVDTTTEATMTDYHNGTVTFRGRWINILDSSGGYDYEFTLVDGLSWTEWNDAAPHGFFADCGGIEENYQDWIYYILQGDAAVELQGWGIYAGSLLNISHAPSNQYFGHQIGLGANNYNAQYGMGGWATANGVVYLNGQPISNGTSVGSCNIRFTMPSCTSHTSEVTWTATDCSGNTATCSQIVHFEPTLDQPECFVDNPCNDNDPCTIGDTYQADCSCAGSLLDANNDGVCDLSAPCEGVVVGDPCDDLDPCTLNDITQPDCTCVGTYTDTDADGICDALDDCDSSLAGTVCNDGDDCTVNDVIQVDCTCSGLFSDGDGDGVCDAQDPCNNSLAGGSCDDGDACTINDIIQSDCSCVGTYADNDGDGVCDAADPCDNFLSGNPCDDNNPCTMNDILQADCSCAGIYADADGDGVCDAEDNCDNTLAGTVCDDGDACTVNDVIQADCVCAGTYTDTDEDGVCDASEIAGCMDMEACNYAMDATDEDGSCTYVESLAIDGSAQATSGETVVYTYPGPTLSTYAWSANPGAILTGQGTTQVSVVWESALSGIISVVETNNENCGGDTVMLAVSIEPSGVPAWSQEYLVVYPNPASDQINLIGNIPTGTPLFLYNSIGACVMTTPFASTIDVGHLPAGLYHLRIALANVRLEQSLVILR